MNFNFQIALRFTLFRYTRCLAGFRLAADNCSSCSQLIFIRGCPGASLLSLIFLSSTHTLLISLFLCSVSVSDLLIQRLSVQQVLEVSSEWKTNKSESQYTWLEYDFRVTCDPHYYGSGCANLCRPRDDQFGHYTCSETGEIICLTGWQGTYCEKREYIGKNWNSMIN